MTGNCSCGRQWASLREAHCRTCHAHFSTVDNFDRHQPDRRRCPDPASHHDRNGNPVLKAVDRAGGTVWVQWTPEERIEELRERGRGAGTANAR